MMEEAGVFPGIPGNVAERGGSSKLGNHELKSQFLLAL